MHALVIELCTELMVVSGYARELMCYWEGNDGTFTDDEFMAITP